MSKFCSENVIKWPRISEGFVRSEMTYDGWFTAFQVFGGYKINYSPDELLGKNFIAHIDDFTSEPDRMLYAITNAIHLKLPHSFRHYVGKDQNDMPRIARVFHHNQHASIVLFQYELHQIIE